MSAAGLHRRHFFCAILAGWFALGLMLAAGAAEPAGGIEVRDGWVRWLPVGLPAAGYLTLVNHGDEDRFVTGASSADYAQVHLHESFTTPDGDARMRPVSRLRVPAHGEVALAPGSYHLMLIDPKREIGVGGTATIALRFADGTELEVKLPVKAPAKNG